MDKKRIEIIITVALILIFILAWSASIKKLKKRSEQKFKSQVELIPPGRVEPDTAEPIYKKEKGQIQEWERIKWVRCPFSNRIYSGQEGVSDLELAGIIWDKRAPMAVINERIVKVGDNIGVNKIIEIKPDRVILNDGAGDFELKVK